MSSEACSPRAAKVAGSILKYPAIKQPIRPNIAVIITDGTNISKPITSESPYMSYALIPRPFSISSFMPLKTKTYYYTALSGKGNIVNLIGDDTANTSTIKINLKSIKFKSTALIL